jgi:hypothetical protein
MLPKLATSPIHYSRSIPIQKADQEIKVVPPGLFISANLEFLKLPEKDRLDNEELRKLVQRGKEIYDSYSDVSKEVYG